MYRPLHNLDSVKFGYSLIEMAAQEDPVASIFSRLDANRDGQLSFAEARAFFRSKGVNDTDAKHIFASVDADQSKSLDLTEFRRLHKHLSQAWLLSPYPRVPPASMTDMTDPVAVFSLLDTNCDGVLSFDEVKSFFKSRNVREAFRR